MTMGQSKVVQTAGNLHDHIGQVFLGVAKYIFDNPTPFDPGNDMLHGDADHMYEFQLGGKGPNDPNAKRYGLPMAFEERIGEAEIAGDVTQTSLDSLKLKVGAIFGYWFDFGDDWWHQINVMAIEEKASSGDYPKVIERIGASPPQYIDEEE